MQWSPPCYLVLNAHHNTCTVRPLTSATGRGGKFPQDATKNSSCVKVATLRPTDFWIGARVLRKHKQAWFLGTIIDVHEDKGLTLYQVDYDDCGQEDIDRGELYDSVVYHPRLEHGLYHDTQLPAINQLIMFALQREPRFGKIVEINPLHTKPLSVVLWKPSNKAKSVLSARFKSTQHLETGTEIVRIAPAQIKTHVEFTPEGRLDKDSLVKVRNILTRSQRQPHSKIPKAKRELTRRFPKKQAPAKKAKPKTTPRMSSAPGHRYPTRSRIKAGST